jgi:hypothetical protein
MTTRLLATAALVGTIGHSQGTGRVEGTIRTESGGAVPGAVASIHVRPTGTGTRPYDARTTVGPAGAFSFDGVPPGTYLVCGQAPGRDLINACFWQIGSPRTVVVAAEQTVRVDVALADGFRLRVRLDDPAGVMAVAKDDPKGFGVLLAVTAPGAGFVPMLPTKSEASGRDYESLVPFGVPLKLVAQSRAFELGDDKGDKLPNGGHVKDVNIPKGGSLAVVNLRVRRATPR